MTTTRRWAAVTLAAGAVGALIGCPSLGDIHVGAGDAGADHGHVVDSGRHETGGHDTGAHDAPHDAGAVDVSAEKPCTPDLMTDPLNCGTCGHDCVVPGAAAPDGGACQAGMCQPSAIVTGNTGPYGIAVTNGTLYFTSSDETVDKCTVDNCMNTLTQMTSGQEIPHGITTDATNVYWASEGFVDGDGGFSGSISTCGLSGCSGGVATTLATFETGPYDVVVNTNNAFWTDDFGKEVRSCAISGCGQSPTTLANDPKNLSGIAIDDTSIYWAEPGAGNLNKCPLNGCASFSAFATFTPSMNVEIDVVDGTVFWTTNGAIMSCPTASCIVPTVFAANQPNALAITHDALNLYWTLGVLGGKVMTCPLAGCVTPTVLADNQPRPTSVAVDATSVYWANYGGTTVMRLMK